MLIHGHTSNNALTPLLVDATGRPLVVVDSIGTVTVTGTVSANVLTNVLPANGLSTATLSAPGDALTYTVGDGYSVIGAQVTGTWTGQLEFEVTVDGTNWVSHDVINNVTDQIVNATAGNGVFFATVAAFVKFRIRASALSSGSAVVTLKTGVTGESFHLESPLPAGSNLIGNVNAGGGDKIFSMEAALLRAVSNTALAAGTNVLDDSAVPSAKVWVITQLAMAYVGTVLGVNLEMRIRSGGVDYALYNQTPPVSGSWYDRQGKWVLAAGDNLRLSVSSATLNDDAFLRANGYQMDA